MTGNYAIIVAAGKGRRMGLDINKQFVDIGGKPMLYYSVKTFSNNNLIDGIVIVCAREEIQYCETQIVEKYNFKKIVDIVPGGIQRQDSVFNGLNVLKNYNCNMVLIHDGARPFVTHDIINDGIKFCNLYGACACGVEPKDTIKVKENDGFSKNTLDRRKLFMVQTPQCFDYNLILSCHNEFKNKDLMATDDTTVVEYFNHKVYLYNGDYSNIKITTPEDLGFAEKIIKRFK